MMCNKYTQISLNLAFYSLKALNVMSNRSTNGKTKMLGVTLKKNIFQESQQR